MTIRLLTRPLSMMIRAFMLKSSRRLLVSSPLDKCQRPQRSNIPIAPRSALSYPHRTRANPIVLLCPTMKNIFFNTHGSQWVTERSEYWTPVRGWPQWFRCAGGIHAASNSIVFGCHLSLGRSRLPTCDTSESANRSQREAKMGSHSSRH